MAATNDTTRVMARGDSTMQLYSFFRSGSSHRLRIALNLKGLAYKYKAVDLRSKQHLDANYKAIQPQGLVPALVLNDQHGRRVLIQSPDVVQFERRFCSRHSLSAYSALRRASMSCWAKRPM